MKKLYASIIACCTSMFATAASPVMPLAKGEISVSNDIPEFSRVITRHNDCRVVEIDGSRALKSPAKAHEADQWEALGEGTMFEGIVSSLFFNDVPSYKVAVEKSSTTEGLYRVLEPYKQLAELKSALFDYDAAKAEPMYLVVKDNKFYIESFATGLVSKHASVPGDVSLNSNTYNLVKANGVDLCLSAIPDAFGDLAGGVFSFASPNFSMNGSNYYSLLLGFSGADDFYGGNGDGAFKLLLPGATVTDYSIKAEYNDCADDNVFKFAFKLGSSVENYKIYISAGEYSKSVDNFQYVAQNGQNFTKGQLSLAYTAPATAKEGIYTVFAVTVDAEGNYKEGLRLLLYVCQPNNDDWEAMDGKALFTDDFVASVYKNHDDAEREVAIEKSKTTPGCYRLVNAYAAPYAYAAQGVQSCTHNHYLYINASNPEQVYITESPAGIDFGDGAFMVNSMANYRMTQNAAVDATQWGKLKNDEITFPVKSLIARELKYNDAGWSYANTSGAFKVKLPKENGAGTIVADDNDSAPVEYFNLQGQRIDTPVAGQLVVKRQGSKVQKIMAR